MGLFIGVMALAAFVLITVCVVNDSPVVSETVQERDIPANEVLNLLYKKYGSLYGLDPYLLKAIAIIESSENPYAVHEASNSYGLMQILCQPNGYGGCKNKFNISDWPPFDSNELYNADYSLNIGSQILKWNINTYGLNKGIAVYNSWSTRNDAKMGPFRNQEYVDKVMGKYHELQKSGILA